MARVKQSRAETVAANDRALRQAAFESIIETGWDGLTFTGVAKKAGLTVGAVYARAENPAELAIDLWEHTAAPWFEESVAAVIDSARAGDVDGMTATVDRWDRAEDMSAVVVGLLMASLFDEDLKEVIGHHARDTLSASMVPSTTTPRVTKHEAAAATLVLSFAFGRAITLRGGVQPPPFTRQQAEVQAGMFAGAAARGPSKPPKPLVWIRPMADVDPTQRAILQGALAVVGRVGYRRATIARIARAAQVPRGSVMSHYKDKAHLVGEAAELGLIPPGEVWEQYADVVEAHGPLISRAMFLAEFLKPENRPLWAVNLELSRMARLLPELATFRPTPNVLENTHLGVMLAASLMPDLSGLPFAGPFTAGTAT